MFSLTLSVFSLTKYNPKVCLGYLDRSELESGYICCYWPFQSLADEAVQISIVEAKTIFPGPDWNVVFFIIFVRTFILYPIL